MSNKLRNINKRAINEQMALPLIFKTIKNRENYLISKCNQEAINLIENYSFWQNRKKTNSIPGAIIYGPKGSGKTHLSSILKKKIDCVYLTSLSNNCLEKVTEGKNFILDNFIPGKVYPSELVMHFMNQVTYKEGSILLLSRLSPFEMNWNLDDLNSRIRSLISSEIKLPDDVLLYSFIVKYSNEKNLFISDKKLLYILERLDRSFDSVIKVINRLDTYSLELNEKVTYKNIKKILDNLNDD
tara:strand:+ start:173 stop:898 length:726 start_codon:yes stop_codon:yes gene_type:complete